MVRAAQEAAAPVPQLWELIEGRGSPTASAAPEQCPVLGQEGGKAGEQALEGPGVSRREAVSVGARRSRWPPLCSGSSFT